MANVTTNLSAANQSQSLCEDPDWVQKLLGPRVDEELL